MFNWSLKFRKQTEFISPKGPNFDWAPWHDLNISGTHIKIKVPNNRSTIPTRKDDVISVHDLNKMNTTHYEKNEIPLNFYELLYRDWEFYGPWFTGRRGGIIMQACIISPIDIPEGLNYFHPRALEAGIVDELTQTYGHRFSQDQNRQTWLAPMNWQPRNNLPCIAARFDAINSIVKQKGPECFLIIPLTKHHFLKITCDISRAGVFTNKVPEPTVDQWIDPEPFLKLANQVLDSVQVTLSPQAQADQEEALRGLEDKSLAKEFLPLKWSNPLKNEDNVIT